MPGHRTPVQPVERGLPPTPGAPPCDDALSPACRQVLLDRLYARYGRGTWMLRLRYVWKKYAFLSVVGGAEALKRGIDILGALAGLALAAPVLLAAAVAIRLGDGGPVFYVAPRVGRYGRTFPFPKLRTMRPEADALRAWLHRRNDHGAEAVTFKMRNDPRVTPVGRVLRRFSIDELPQFWSVLLGHMSLVGPRPPLPEEVERYTLRERQRLAVKPGLTCIWQVSGRGDVEFAEQVRLDLAYLESRTLALDLRLLLQTVPAVLLGRGAY